jgi:UDP-N-acetylglucosamine--N-acetylmuramyl-(pentapeptide) pyrophosphoryl-undecaprenol N-acetylglucosamine transferase
MAGGTGGHVYPALAIARALERRTVEVIWLGTRRGLEAGIVPQAGIPIEWISVRGLRRTAVLALVLAPFQLGLALLQSLGVMLRHRPAAVLGMGGFVSGPGGVAAWLTRRPLIIHEQNAVAGLTNRLLARVARVVLEAFPGSFSPWRGARTVGNPVRDDIGGIEDPATRLADRQGRLRLLVLGGSQGSLKLNEIVPAALARLPRDSRPIVRHQAGTRTIAIAREAYERHGLEVELEPFIDDMAAAYVWADLVICRAGALTVSELAAAGLPAIFVPFAAAVDDHQTANARPMAETGAAAIIGESALTAERLAAVLSDWLSSREALRRRAIDARRLSKPHAVEEITDLCLAVAGARP